MDQERKSESTSGPFFLNYVFQITATAASARPELGLLREQRCADVLGDDQPISRAPFIRVLFVLATDGRQELLGAVRRSCSPLPLGIGSGRPQTRGWAAVPA
jgi:hypothetical protein